MGMSAFGVEDGRISKADDGDKKKTKYAAAGLAGSAAGVQAGARLGARSAGTRLKVVQRGAGEAAMHGLLNNTSSGLKGTYRGVASSMRAVPGFKAATAGGRVGQAAGVATGVGAYAMHRRNKAR